MARVEGVARNVRIDREEDRIVLRFVLEVEGGDPIPVEMRGKKVLGVLDSGDRVAIHTRGEEVRGRDGIAHPYQVENLRTRSFVRVPLIILWEEIVKFLLSVALSALTGWLSSLLLSFLTGISPVVVAATPGGEERVGVQPLFFAVGAVVGLAVFFFLFILPRLRALAQVQE